MPRCNTDQENEIVTKARQLMAVYEDMAELIRLGAYRRGSDPSIDEAIHYYPMIESFLEQKITESTNLATGYQLLAEALSLPIPETPEDITEENGENVEQPEQAQAT